MPDVEVLKLLFNGGAFGLLAIIVVWILFYGAPMLRDTLKYVVDKNDSAVDKLIQWFERRYSELGKDAQEDRTACRASRHEQANKIQGVAGELADDVRRAVRDELDRWGKS